jgi:hypothetical protein
VVCLPILGRVATERISFWHEIDTPLPFEKWFGSERERYEFFDGGGRVMQGATAQVFKAGILTIRHLPVVPYCTIR